MLDEAELRELFALIPEAEAQKARTEILEQLSQVGSHSDNRVSWVDLESSFKIVSAGVIEMGGVSTVHVINPSEVSTSHPELVDLLSQTQRSTVRAGDIFLSAMPDRLIWIVPFGLSDAQNATAIRAVSISFHVLFQILDSLNPHAKLTVTEKRVICHILAGLTPKQSASHDGVQSETRRGQVKSACAKLSVSGQNSLVRLVLSQTIHLLFHIEDEKNQSTEVADFAALHFPANVRLVLWHLPGGRTLRVFETGPEDAPPVVMQHGLFFVPLIQSFAAEASTHSLRLIMPLRSGYWSSQSQNLQGDAASSESELDADLKSYIEGRLGSDVLMMGHSMGCVHATRFTAQNPDLVKNLVLVSPYFGRAPRDSGGYLSRIMRVLGRVQTNQILFRLVASQFAHSYSNNRIAQSALHRIFRESAEDMDIIRGNATVPAFDGWFGSLFRNSVSGIANDFQSTLKFDAQTLNTLEREFSILYGDEDPIGWGKDLAQVIDGEKLKSCHAYAGNGHFLMVSARSEVLKHLAASATV